MAVIESYQLRIDFNILCMFLKEYLSTKRTSIFKKTNMVLSTNSVSNLYLYTNIKYIRIHQFIYLH